MFSFLDDFEAPFLSKLLILDKGSYYLDGTKNSGIDYIRGGFITKEQFEMRSSSYLVEFLTKILSPYISLRDGSKIYFVGSRFPKGIHDQRDYYYDKPWHDGAIIIYNANTKKCQGAFFHFQGQK